MKKMKNEKGTVTLEACIVVPMFIILMLAVCGLIVLFMGQQIVTHTVIQSAKSMAFDPYGTERSASAGEAELAQLFSDIFTLGHSDYISTDKWYSDNSHRLSSVASTRFHAFLSNDKNKRDDILESIGVSNLRFSNCKVENGVLTMTVDYNQKFLFDAGGLGNFDRSVSVMVRLFSYSKLGGNEYEVSFSTNGGKGTISNVVTSESNAALPTPTRDGYAFMGWSTDQNAKVPNVSTLEDAQKVGSESNGKAKLYAVWQKTGSTVSYTASGPYRDKTLKEGKSHTDTVRTDLDVNALKENGYTKVSITIKFDCKRTALICYNKAKVDILSADGSKIYSKQYDSVFGYSWELDKTITLDIPIDQLGADGTFKIKWSTENGFGASGDGWVLGETTITVNAKK